MTLPKSPVSLRWRLAISSRYGITTVHPALASLLTIYRPSIPVAPKTVVVCPPAEDLPPPGWRIIGFPVLVIVISWIILFAGACWERAFAAKANEPRGTAKDRHLCISAVKLQRKQRSEWRAKLVARVSSRAPKSAGCRRRDGGVSLSRDDDAADSAQAQGMLRGSHHAPHRGSTAPSINHQSPAINTIIPSISSSPVSASSSSASSSTNSQSMDIDPKPVPEFLTQQRDEVAPDSLQPLFLDFEEYWERKLWHQLTGVLVQFFEHPESAPQRILLYKNFVLTFSDKINQLKLVTLGLSASRQCKDNQDALEFLTALATKVNKPDSKDAYVYATVEVARVKLLLKDMEGARKALDDAEKHLETFDSVESVVHASFYRVNADYYNAKLEFASYYKNALLYLACVRVSELSTEEQQERAYNLSVAALLGESIYNFGELLLHPILDSLKNTEHAWLRELLFAFNAGNLAGFHGLSGHLSKQPLLEQQSKFLREKICLSALTETVFRRPPHDRALSFATILEETRVYPEEVEHLLMKALSLGLVRGSIDQVAEVARISWVQPKVLDKEQITNMKQRLLDWDESVNKMGAWMETRLAAPAEA